MTMNTIINLLSEAKPGSFKASHSRLNRNLINAMLFDNELFIIKLGLPISSYFDGCLNSKILKILKQRKNHTKTEQNRMPNIIGNNSLTRYSLHHNAQNSGAVRVRCFCLLAAYTKLSRLAALANLNNGTAAIN